MAITIPAPIVKPFCNSGFETPPPINTDTIVATQETGFPPLQATPLSLGGEPCTIDQMNGVFNFYTQQIQALVSGWKFTFDQDVSDQNGGYPANVILYSPTTNSFQRSLVNNNTANFNTTPSYIDDGINWSSDILINSINITSQINFYNAAKTFYTAIESSNLSTQNSTYKWPFAAPNVPVGQALPSLTVDAAGQMFWNNNQEMGVTSPIDFEADDTLIISSSSTSNNLTLFTSPNYYNFVGTPYNTTTNIFTAPQSGIYRLNLTINLIAVSSTISTGQSFYILINSGVLSGLISRFGYTGYDMSISVSKTFPMSSGDNMYVTIFNEGGTTATLSLADIVTNISWNF